MADKIRAVRPSEPIPGIGGFIEFKWNTDTADVLSRIEIEEWSLRHRYINARLAMSGGLGSIQYDRVADATEFTVMAVMDLRTTRFGAASGDTPNRSSRQPFYDGRMEGGAGQDFKISMHFQCGDSTFWDNPEQQTIARPPEKFSPLGPFRSGIYQTIDEAVIEDVLLVDSSRGDDVLRYIIKGFGSTPIQRWVGEIWTGGGAFGISKAEQGQAPVVDPVVLPPLPA